MSISLFIYYTSRPTSTSHLCHLDPYGQVRPFSSPMQMVHSRRKHCSSDAGSALETAEPQTSQKHPWLRSTDFLLTASMHICRRVILFKHAFVCFEDSLECQSFLACPSICK